MCWFFAAHWFSKLYVILNGHWSWKHDYASHSQPLCFFSKRGCMISKRDGLDGDVMFFSRMAWHDWNVQKDLGNPCHEWGAETLEFDRLLEWFADDPPILETPTPVFQRMIEYAGVRPLRRDSAKCCRMRPNQTYELSMVQNRGERCNTTTWPTWTTRIADAAA